MTKVKDLPYHRATIEDFTAAYNKFDEAVKVATCAEDVLKARKEFMEGGACEYFTNSALAQCRFTLDMSNEFYKAEQDYYDEVGPLVSNLMVKMADYMLTSPFRAELEKALPEPVFLNYEFAKKSHSEAIIEDQQEENALTTGYSQLMSGLMLDWNGEKKPMSYVRGFLEDEDRNVRRAAAEAIGKGMESVADQLDKYYDDLVKVRDRMAKKLGYENYIELGYYRMGRIDYNKEMVEKFRANVLESIVPAVKEIKAKIADELGIDQIMIYDNDIVSAEGNPRPFGTKEEIFEAAKKMYNEMNPEIGAFMEAMQEAEAFDVESRIGKWGGGYCTAFAKYKQPFILANFNGSSGDIDVMTHEFGHAWAMYKALHEGDMETDVGSMETAETHSMSMEFFSWPWMNLFFKDAQAYCRKHLTDALTFIPYGVIVDEFQHRVYEKPEMTPAERKQVWLELEAKYRPYISYEGIPYLEQGTRWQYQMHIYESPFYYIDYCLAQVVALEFLSDSLQDYDDALKRYMDHAARGGMFAFNTLVKKAGLASPFEEGALAKVIDNIIEKLKTL